VKFYHLKNIEMLVTDYFI